MDLKTFKDNLIEFIKYDYNEYKSILVLFSYLACKFFQLLNKHPQAFNLASQVYRTGWKHSDRLGLYAARYYFVKHKELGKKVVEDALNNIQELPNTKKFIHDPELMLDGVINVLKAPSENEKGAIIINYSFYFSLFYKFYDVQSILKDYSLILEPSWAGLCELNILAYTACNEPIYLQVYEQRDRTFLENLNTNIVPIDVGPSWFVDHQLFDPKESTSYALDGQDCERDIDIIMVAAWAAFKRHKAFFEAIKPLIERRPETRIVLVGYPVDMTQEDIIESARIHGVVDNIVIHEWIKPTEVRDLLCRAKVNVLWSKFEGNNRAIIEGMFCDVPCIMRNGHNYGEHYDFINSSTGCFSTELNLANDVERIIQEAGKYSPRRYVMGNRNCVAATGIMSDVIKDVELSAGRKWTKNLSVKLNGLHGMNYLTEDPSIFKSCYEYLSEKLK